ncbi:hydrolase [Streptomyces sp. BH-SS-21]|uniref:Hydrolase n=1 Tax=Streptomyces liliiviolaceus TaxID=2823109 RepID=A0A941B7G1_9ACTN|nr:alpha/beta family hydrolase [Streptomyces liliiviolaceus]MBQ0853525.1 hydrolase [Streptomyces liliiviolaceus]
MTEIIETVETVETDAGTARITWRRAEKADTAEKAAKADSAGAKAARLVLAVSHGAGGGIEARDLRALAAALPAHGVTVALVEQPWRVAGKKLAPAPKTLDAGWRGLWPALAAPGLPVVAGGRSAGARVACRTATELGAHAVLALSFPLHPPGRPERSRADELLGAGVPTLVVQGGNDPFGRPEEFPDRTGPDAYELVEVPYGDHGFAVPKRAPVDQEQALTVVTDGVLKWVSSLP